MDGHEFIQGIDKALDTLLQNTKEYGRILNVSGGTTVMSNRAGYLGDYEALGTGLGLDLSFLTALLERQKRELQKQQRTIRKG